MPTSRAPATYDNINYGQNITVEGAFPFTNSAHPGGSNMVFCDGAVRFISSSINGTVYAKIITPAGSRLPVYMRQLPVSTTTSPTDPIGPHHRLMRAWTSI